jgi:NAD(P)-dependent dehydrogenase (short-subunit alcohol dehydrogenase family)
MSNTSKTVFITGASSGIGLESALYFHERGWNVIATMRHPEKRQTALHEKGLPDLLHLDVLDDTSIQAALKYSVDKYQTIDVLVNNAGYAAYGPFESTTPDQVKREFDTNVFGLMAVTRAFLPLFRQQKGGTLVNVASMGGRLGFPLYSIYNSTKWAVEGFSEALMYELKPLNIKVRLIEPGVIKTDFYNRSLDKTDSSAYPGVYDRFIERGKKGMGESAIQRGMEPIVVAQAIYKAATDTGWRLRYPVGSDAKLVQFIRWLVPEGLFYRLIESNTLD